MTDVTDIMLDASVYNLAIQKNVTVEIMTDDSPSNPRAWDNIGTMYITDKRIDNLGDIFIPNFDETVEEHASVIAYFADRLYVKKIGRHHKGHHVRRLWQRAQFMLERAYTRGDTPRLYGDHQADSTGRAPSKAAKQRVAS